MDKIKQRQQQEQLRQELSQQGGQQAAGDVSNGARPRSNTTDLVKTSATAGHTPPYRRAPPPPRDKRDSREVSGAVNNGINKDESRSPRRKPARPAPQAPMGRKNEASSSLGEQIHGDTVSPVSVPQYSPPHPLGRTRSYSQDGYSTMESERGGYGTLESDRDGYSTLESGQHIMVDLAISQSDREPMFPQEGEEDQLSPLHSKPRTEPHLALMQQLSSSLPEMLDETGNSTSPEAMEDHDHTHHGENTSKHSPGSRHTRHLSLIGGSKDAHHNHSRRKPKRAGSLKQRSRSPPNLPPPPPPPPPSDPGANALLDTSGMSMRSNTSSASLGFSEVMQTMSSIDHELDTIAENFTTSTVITPSMPPGRPPPPPPTQVDTAAISSGQSNLGPSPTSITLSPTSLSPTSQQCNVPSPVPEAENENGEFCEEEWLCDEPELNNGVTNGHAHQDTVRRDSSSDETKPKKQLRVMFKDEVEAIPSYEPRVDLEEGDDSLGEETAIDEVPTGVAAIKMKLFGQKESVATRYKKEGILCPKFTHPVNTTFSDQYFDTDVMDNPAGHTHNDITNGNGSHAVSIIDRHDNANNNNSENHSNATEVALESPALPNSDPTSQPKLDPLPPSTQVSEETKKESTSEQPLSPATPSGEEKSDAKHHNVYECPWEDKPISKYKVIGIVRKTASPSSKTKSPPPTAHKKAASAAGQQRMQFAEVSTKDTPKPSATEVRNVHSLERNMLMKTRSLPLTPPTTLDGADYSLLASISSTLKETSLYGSDTLLCNGAEGKESKVTTTQGEKLREAHRTDDATITYSSSVVSLPDPSQYTTEYSLAANSADSTPFKNAPRGSRHPSKGLAGTRMTKSLDGLESKETQVTYNHHIHAHVLRSLV